LTLIARTSFLVLAAAGFLVGCGKSPPPDATSSEAGAELPANILGSASASASATPPSPSASASADAVTQASAPYQAGPSVLASGSVDGAALRKRHIERLKSDTSAVTVLKGQTPLELGKRICEAVVPKRPPSTPVLLKPNLCGFDSIKDPEKFHGDDGVHGRGTDVGFTRGVVQCLKARGHKTITIAEGCGISHKHWLTVAHLTGYDTMAKEEGVGLVAMDDDGVFDVEGDQPGKPLAITGIGSTHVPTLLLPKILAETLDHGLFLSLPKIKAHRYAVVSMAIKGMQGTVMLSDKAPGYKQKWRMHKELGEYLDQRKQKLPEDRALYVATLLAFADRMVDTLEISTPDAVLAEGAPGMAGDGFQSLRPTAEKVAIGGTNPVLVDRVGSAFLGLYNNPALGRELGGHPTSPLIEIAAKRYKLDLKSTTIVGDGASLLDAPRPAHFKAMAPFSIDFDPPGVKTPAGPDWDALGHGPPAGDLPAVDHEAAPEAPAAPASATPPPAPPAPPPHAANGKPEAHAAALGADAITIDGKGDDAAWSRATAVSWQTDYAGVPSGITTRARFVWSKSGLYALLELSGAGLHVDTSHPVAEERKGLYNEDCAEIFFTPDPARPKHYFEIELGPFGHYFDIEIDRDSGKQNTAWSSGARIATTRNAAAHTAVIEALLTAPEIVAVLAPGARLPLGLYRMEGTGDRHYLAWSPPRTPKPNFHVPDAFGALLLDPG
jgi:uncharacterized protein (DUF362 family)